MCPPCVVNGKIMVFFCTMSSASDQRALKAGVWGERELRLFWEVSNCIVIDRKTTYSSLPVSSFAPSAATLAYDEPTDAGTLFMLASSGWHLRSGEKMRT